MKSAFFILCILVCAACKDKEQKPYYGEVSVLINGVKYEGDLGITCCDPKDTLEFHFWQSKTKQVSRKYSFTSEMYSVTADRVMQKQFIRNCDYYRDSGCRATARFFTSIDDDVLGDRYEIFDSLSADNYIEITKETGNFKEIWGNFQFSLARINQDPTSHYPDTLRFTEGKFHLLFNE